MSSAEPSSASVQREVEMERAELVSTLDQLRENLRPGNVIDEVMAGAKIDTTVMSEKLWKTARANPIPAVLIGLGAAMLMGVGSKVVTGKGKSAYWSEGRRYPSPSLDRTGAWSDVPATETVATATKRTARQFDAASARASAAVSKISKSAGDLRQQASRTADATAASVRQGFGTKSNEDVMNSYDKSRQSLTGSLTGLLDDQPLILAALGIAVGAAIGASIPATNVESRLMGDASGSVKQSAHDLAQDQYAQLKTTAGEALADLKKTAAEHGVSSENLTGLVQDVSGRVRDAAVSVAAHAADGTTGRV